MLASAWQAIMSNVKASPPRTNAGDNIWLTQEIIPDAEARRDDYLPVGTINEFKFTYLMRDAFRRSNDMASLGLACIPGAMGIWGNWGGSWGFLQPANATVFINNWDTERNPDDSLNASNDTPGATNDARGTKRCDLANIFMLAQGRSRPTAAMCSATTAASSRPGDGPRLRTQAARPTPIGRAARLSPETQSLTFTQS